MNGSRDKKKNWNQKISHKFWFLVDIFISNLICKIWNEISNFFLWTRFYILSVSEINRNYDSLSAIQDYKRWSIHCCFYLEQLIVLRRLKDECCRSFLISTNQFWDIKKSTRNQFWWLIFCSDLKHEFFL